MLASSCLGLTGRGTVTVGRAGGRSLAGDEGAGVDPDRARRGNAVVVVRARSVRPGGVVGDRPRARRGVLAGAALRRPDVDGREPRAEPPPRAVQSGRRDVGRSDPRPDEARARGRRRAREPTRRRFRASAIAGLAVLLVASLLGAGSRPASGTRRDTRPQSRGPASLPARSLAAADPFAAAALSIEAEASSRPPYPNAGHVRALGERLGSLGVSPIGEKVRAHAGPATTVGFSIDVP